MAGAAAGAHMPRMNRMETAMNADLDVSFAPRTIAQARTRRAHAFSRLLRIALRKVQAGLRAFWTRLVRTWQYHRELELLIHADDRMLADIGLTRFDVVSAAQESRGWHGRRDALRAAATRRDDAISVARARRSRLPEMQAPPIVPALPCAMETSSFR
jgi:aspartate oxidase